MDYDFDGYFSCKLVDVEFSITIWSLMLLFGCVQSILLCAYFLSKSEYRNNRNYLLCFLLLTFCVISFDHSLRLSNLYKSFPGLIYISDGLWFLIAPTLFLIARLTVNSQYQFKLIDIIHVVPYVIMQIFYLKLVFASPEVKIRILQSYIEIQDYGLLTKLTILGMMLQILFYIYFGYKLLKRYEQKYMLKYSETQLDQLRMFRSMFLFFLVYFAFEFTFSTVRNFTAFESQFLNNWSLVVWTFFVYGLAYIILSRPKLFLPYVGDKKGLVEKLNSEDEEDLNAVIEFMHQHKPYKRADLTLPELAGEVGLPTNRLSYLINSKKDVNFYSFINRFRVLEAKRLFELGLDNTMSIMGIAQEAGFRSKSSFYKFFKKEFNQTPSQFMSNSRK